MNEGDRSQKLSASNEELMVFVIRVVCLGLLGYWSLILLRPFLAIIDLSIIIAVALYPIFDWLSASLGIALAAVAVTVFTLLVMLGPVTWLLIWRNRSDALAQFGDGSLVIPPLQKR